jgi:sodium-dependent phosphate cotransporter
MTYKKMLSSAEKYNDRKALLQEDSGFCSSTLTLCHVTSFQVQREEESDNDSDKKISKYNVMAQGLGYVLLSMTSLYFFMVAVKLIGDAFTLLLGCQAKDAFDFANNPIAGLMIGTVATAVLHSSGTVTSIIVALVSSGGMTVRQAVPVIMGANVGTCVTCIMVAFGQVGNRDQFERAMAAATVHDMYNIWSVFIMFPIEVLIHPLEYMSVGMSNAKASHGDFKSPVDALVNPLTNAILKVDKKTIYDVAVGKISCRSDLSLIAGGMFGEKSDGTAAVLTLCLGFCILVASLLSLVRMLAKVFLGPTRKLIGKLLAYNGYVNIVVGTLITFAVHSSTVVTSTLTPMAGLGVITLEQVYPLVIGANLGTTGTALLASMVTGKADGVAIALVHFWFNLLGIFFFYPIPITRKPILDWARQLAFFSAAWPMSAGIFLFVLFLLAPGILLGLVYMCTAQNISIVVLGSICTLATIGACLRFAYWYVHQGGQAKWYNFLEMKRSARLEASGTSKPGAEAVVVPLDMNEEEGEFETLTII